MLTVVPHRLPTANLRELCGVAVSVNWCLRLTTEKRCTMYIRPTKRLYVIQISQGLRNRPNDMIWEWRENENLCQNLNEYHEVVRRLVNICHEKLNELHFGCKCTSIRGFSGRWFSCWNIPYSPCTWAKRKTKHKLKCNWEIKLERWSQHV